MTRPTNATVAGFTFWIVLVMLLPLQIEADTHHSFAGDSGAVAVSAHALLARARVVHETGIAEAPNNAFTWCPGLCP
jgi:hypothetical protein